MGARRVGHPRALMAVLAIVVISASAACRNPVAAQTASSKEAPMAYVDSGDAEVNAAIVQARRYLPQFWAKFDQQPAGVDFYTVKVAFPTSGGGAEHIWVDVISHQGDVIVGKIDNDPEYRKDLKIGQIVDVKAADISDWSYRRDGKLFGHFTTRVLLKHVSPAEAEETRQMLAPTPLESGGS